jgi:hypothetical protein
MTNKPNDMVDPVKYRLAALGRDPFRRFLSAQDYLEGGA